MNAIQNQKKLALVTGASEGIGREFALQLAREGFVITAVARNQEKLNALIEELNRISTSGHKTLAADLQSDLGVAAVSAEVARTHYDLFVNNAGFGIYGNFLDVDLKRQLEMINLNCNALTTLSFNYLKTAQKGDVLLNVASTLALIPLPGAAVYAATKAFVNSLTESLWYEMKNKGIFVMDLCPGITTTAFHSKAGESGSLPEAMTQTAEQVVRYGIRQMKRQGKPTVVSGPVNKTFTFMARLVPRKTMVSILGSMK